MKRIRDNLKQPDIRKDISTYFERIKNRLESHLQSHPTTPLKLEELLFEFQPEQIDLDNEQSL